MNNKQLIKVLQECGQFLKLDLDSQFIAPLESFEREYRPEELPEFIRDLVEAGSDAGLILLEKHMPKEAFFQFMSEYDSPVIVFAKVQGEVVPILIRPKRGSFMQIQIQENETHATESKVISNLDLACTDKLEVIFLAAFNYQSLVSKEKSGEQAEHISPVKRLLKLLSADRRDIFYVYVYAALIGLLSLSLPLGIQAAIELISGGVVFSSVYVLIGLIILGVVGMGIMQVLQITIVEYLQRRLFTKAAFEFAFRVPRIRIESAMNLHMPELMNRFFDVLTLQKGMPKLLIDLSTGAIQIIFGLLLLSFYHPFFVFFGLILIAILVGIFYATGPKGMKSSITESKYKYKVVYWLEEMARTLYSFKLSGNTKLPIKKTDYNVNNYLKNRSIHFKVLISQYAYVLLFKAIVTGGLLIIGTMLVVQREITLGQFVASEVIIILILGSVEKIIMYMDVVYDMLTAVDKISHVTDLPLEQTGGIDLPVTKLQNGLALEIKNVAYRYPGNTKNSIENINLKINAGERICISGGPDSGKTTLTNIIAGIHTEYEGIITYNRYNLRDLDRTSLRDRIAKNVSQEDIFEGTVLENILLGKPFASMETAINAIERVGLADAVYGLKDGLNTQMLSAGKGYSSTFINKLILARCLAKNPSLLILNDFFGNFQKFERLQLIDTLTNKDANWTLILVSNDPLVMAASDRVIYMEGGRIIADGSFEEVLKVETVVRNIY